MSATEQTPKGLKILVVDDDPFLLRLYRLKLSRWSISPNVRVARSGSEALIRIGEQRPDMLITDLFMSDTDGFQMLQELRNRQDMAEICIAAVTGLTKEDIAQRQGLPASVHIFHKPVDFSNLEELARKCAYRSRISRQIEEPLNVAATQEKQVGTC